MLQDNLHTFEKFTKHPEKYLGVQNELSEDIKQYLKMLYDFTKTEESLLPNKCAALPELIIDEFDDEQIWQELELQNDGRCNQFIINVANLVAQKDKLKFPVKLKCHESSNSSLEKSDDESSVNEAENQDSLNGDANAKSSDGEEDDNVKTIKRRNKSTAYSKPSIVDDQFFKLQDLETFLDNEDKKESKLRKANNKVESESDSDSENVDYFEDNSMDEDDKDEEDTNDLHYADFFDAPGESYQENSKSGTNKKRKKEEVSGEEDIDEEGEEVDDDDNDNEDGDEEEDEEIKADKRVRFELSPASSSDDSSEDESKTKESDAKSSFEVRQERLKSRIEHLEEDAIGEKTWQMKGEVSAAARPQNSLLEEVLEFDLTTRPAPVVTEKTTLRLEDIIQQRIKDRVWDDVVRKVKPVGTPAEYKKKLVMNQEKSKQSLSEVYEQEYIKQREAQNPTNAEAPEEEPPEHQEVRSMMSALFVKLDALSNFHYTPKPVAPDVKVISNLPAIVMEEVAPVATSNAVLLAPEEVKAKSKGDVMGKNERTKTDKKRERRHKKAMQRDRQKEREKREKAVEKIRPGLGNKYSKERAVQMLERVTKDKNVSQMEDNAADKGVRSSTAFFARLQEEVSSHIKSKTKSTNKSTKVNFSAKRLKL